MARRNAAGTTVKLGPRDAAIIIRDNEGPEVLLPSSPDGRPASDAAVAVGAIVAHSLPSLERLWQVVEAYLDQIEIHRATRGRPLSPGSDASN